MTLSALQDDQTRTSDPDRPVGFFRAFHPHALEVLEFARLLDHVAGHASSTPGAAAVRALQPQLLGGELLAEHARVAAMRALVEAEDGWSPEAIPDLGAALARLRVAGTSWSGAEFRSASVLLKSSRITQRALQDERKHPAARAPLAPLAAALVSLPALEARIDRVITDEGEVRDDASPLLRKLRRELRGAEGELVRLLERLMAKLESHQRVDDASVTLRNGRYVIPVRREARGAVGGIVQDTSHSGQTLFVEPPAAVEAGNRIRELEADERDETERILRELTDELRPEHESLDAALAALIALDSLYARARYAVANRCANAELVPAAAGFAIREGRHPLLLAQGVDVVPFDLEMFASERTLLVSGPNTGGKTVLLKALALLALMTQSGIPAPVAAESRIPCFDNVYADIGDEQSLAASLSTFSAHLKNLTEILERSSADSLVLIDEIGSGTDPLEGAALGGAILEALTARGTTTIATTHLGALKELAGEVAGVVNASLQFDAERFAPSYRLIKGIPGRSYGLAIAKRLRMPAEVIARAEARVPQMERDLSALLADVEQRSEALATRETEVAAQQEELQRRSERIATRERAVRDKERDLERVSRQEARRYLLDARKEVEATIRELKAAGASALDGLAADARRLIEVRANDEKAALERIDEAVRAEAVVPVDERGVTLNEGDAVSVGTLGGKTGRLLSLRGTDGVVAVGALKLTVPLETLRRIAARHLRAEPVIAVAVGDTPEIEAKPEVDVRGVRVHEVDDLVLQAIDGAVRADLPSLRIIHGKGTGALRERVTQLLKRDGRVKGHRMGAWNEGGAGVTMVDLS